MTPDPAEIIFGLDRSTDERSLAAFLAIFARPGLLDALTPRMSDAELHGLVDTLTGLLRRHLSEEEYHSLFLGEGPRG